MLPKTLTRQSRDRRLRPFAPLRVTIFVHVILSGAKNPDRQPSPTNTLARMFLIRRLIHVCCVSVILVLLSPPAWALYKWTDDASSVEINGMTQIYGIAYKNPDDSMLFKDSGKTGLGGLGRVMLEAKKGDSLTLEANAYQTYIPTALTARRAMSNAAIQDVERSSALEWSMSDDKYIHAAVDRLSLHWSRDRVDIILGRQPVNLATTFYFSPNDFFAPFSAQTFYRVYKPGVDALRAEVRLGELSQLSLISVLGYGRDKNSSTGWSHTPDSRRASYAGRISTNMHNFEWALIAGDLADADIIGGSFQGEIFKWLGIRAEGNIAYPDASGIDSHGEVSMGIERHWENSLDMRLEYFYHGSGLSSAADYSSTASLTGRQGAYPGRRYSALGIGYEFTPLLTGQMTLIGNLIDHSVLSSFNAVYSLSNESEISATVAAPFGRKPDGLNIRSEFGLYPYSFNIEWRWYF
jgi:hypothetical protein